MKEVFLHATLRCRLGFLTAAALVLACRSDGTTSVPPPPTELQFRVVAGGGATDTIEARLLQALIVEIRDSTLQLARGKTIRFEALPADDPSRQDEPTILVKPLDGNQYANLGVDVTDSLGRAQMLIALGSVAGQARLSVHVPEFGRVDTVTYTVKSGKPTNLIIGTRDTTVQPNATYSLNATLLDRFTNPTSGESPTYSAGPGVASVSAGGVVTVGSTFAAGHIIVRWQNVTDTARVSVVERLPLVGFRYNHGVLLINTDGTGFRMIATPSQFGSLSPHAVKATNDVVYYQADPFYNASVWLVTPGGGERMLAGSVNGFRYASWPRWAPDARWVYFVGSRQFGGMHLWRIAPDGSQLDSIAKVAYPSIFVAPTISPDGTTAAINDGPALQLVDIATKSSRHLAVTCGMPRYSPDGRRFACLTQDRLSVVNVDGSGSPALNISPFIESGGVDWSPDGNWLIVNQVDAGPQLINANDGRVLNLRNLGVGTFQLSFVR